MCGARSRVDSIKTRACVHACASMWWCWSASDAEVIASERGGGENEDVRDEATGGRQGNVFFGTHK